MRSPFVFWGVWEMLYNFFFLRSHSISALPKWAFAGCACSFFLVRERTNQESGPKGSALWIPAVLGRSYRYFRPEAKMFVNIFPRLRK
jgi:hypothetical protein